MPRAYPTVIKEDELTKIVNGMKKEPRNMVFSLELINQKIIERNLVLNPEYQRNYVLTIPEASKFIESVFLGCVIPEIQLYEEADGSLEVIDGQQRTTALIKFLNNEYALSRLTQLPILNRYKFEDLPMQLQNKFKNYLLSCRIMKNDNDPNYKFMIFERLNSGSKKLTKQEIRNCIYQGPMLTATRDLNKNDLVLKHLKQNWINLKRQEMDEYVLRLMTVIAYDKDQLMHASNFNINKLLEDYNQKSQEEIDVIKDKFLMNLSLYDSIVSKNYLINKKGVVTKSNIEAVMLLIHEMNSNKMGDELTFEDIKLNKTLFNETIQTVITKNITYQEFVWNSDSKNALFARADILYKALVEAYANNDKMINEYAKKYLNKNKIKA